MKITILTLFPKMFRGLLNESIIKRAKDNKLVKIKVVNLRSFSTLNANKVDDTPYGGGQGMVIRADICYDAIKKYKKKNSKVILTSAQGCVLNQDMLYKLKEEKEIIILCGHYEGIDCRILKHVDYEISVGDYILTGGEIPAMILIDGITRLVNNVIKEESHKDDSFSNNLLEYDQYTRPYDFNGDKVPDVLLSGNHKKIEEFRINNSIEKTLLKRPDLISKNKYNDEIKNIINNIKKRH